MLPALEKGYQTNSIVLSIQIKDGSFITALLFY